VTATGGLLLDPPELDAGAPEQHRRGRWYERHALLVAGFTLVAFLLEVPTITRSYWIDEAISIGIASHPLRDLPPLLRNDGSPPFWYLILHVWLAVFGSSPVATHILPMLTAMAVVPVAYWAGRELFGPTSGLCAAALAATNPFLNWYATETRMYTLVVGLALVSITLAVRALRVRTPGSVVAAVIAYTALDYTHYWGLYLTAVTVIYVAVRAQRSGDLTARNWAVGAGAATFVLYLPWIPSFLEQARNTAAPWAVPPGLGDLFADPSTSLGGTAGIVVAPTLAWAAWRTHRQRPRPVRQATTVIVTITLLTIAVGWLASQLEPSWTVRYLGVTVGPWLVGIAGALGCTRLGRRVVVVLTVGLAAFNVIGNLLPNPHPADTMDNGGAIAAAAAPYLRPGDLVVVSQTEQVPVMAYALGTRFTYLNPFGPVRDPSVVDWQHIVARLERANVCDTIGPSVADLPVGGRILEVDPLDPVGASGSAWATSAHAQVVAIEHFLGTDPALRAVRSFTEAISPKPYSPLFGELFVKVGPSTSCD
jgi:mannosyltransferase